MLTYIYKYTFLRIHKSAYMHDETEHTQYFIVKIENSFNLFVSKFLNNFQSITK